MNKYLLLLLLCLIVSCRFSSSSDSKVKTIAVVNLMPHPILDAVQKGILDELAKSGYANNDSVRIIIKNANSQTSLLPAIVNDVKIQNPDLVIAITTPVAQAFAGKISCPLVFSAVTDPVEAGLVKDLNTPVPNITGASDRTDIEANIRLIRQIHPSAKRLGFLYNPAESASQYGLKESKKHAPDFGFTLVEGVVNSTADMRNVVLSIANKVDVMFISTDNTVAASIPAAIKVAFEKKIPLYAFDEGSVKKGAIASASVNYEEIGNVSSAMAIQMLHGNKIIPVFASSASNLVINEYAAKKSDIIIPEAIRRQAKQIFQNISE